MFYRTVPRRGLPVYESPKEAILHSETTRPPERLCLSLKSIEQPGAVTLAHKRAFRVQPTASVKNVVMWPRKKQPLLGWLENKAVLFQNELCI